MEIEDRTVAAGQQRKLDSYAETDSAGAVMKSQFEVTGFDYSSTLGSVE